MRTYRKTAFLEGSCSGRRGGHRITFRRPNQNPAIVRLNRYPRNLA